VERKDVGKVPAYLKKRQGEAAEQKRLAALPTQPKAPPGYRLVGEAEKSESLSVLKQRRQEAVKQQEKLPFNIETLGQKRREQELKDKIAHLDKLIGMFSKPTVFYPEDADSIRDTFPVQQDTASPTVRRAASPTGVGAAMKRAPSPVGGAGALVCGVSQLGAAPKIPQQREHSSPTAANLGFQGYARQKQPLHTGVQISAPPGGKSSLSLVWS
jgi:hypothetical protein